MKLILSLILALLCVPAFGQDQGESDLLFPVAAPVISYVRGCVNSSGSPATSVSCTISGGVTAGDLLVVAAKVQNTSGNTFATVTSSGVSLSLVNVVPAGNIGGSVVFASAMYAAVIPSTGAETISVSWTGSTGSTFNDIDIAEYHTTATGGWLAPQADRSTSNFSYTSVSSCPTGTTPATTNPFDLVVAVSENFNQAETWGSLTGWTNEAASSRNTVGWYDTTTSTTGTQSASIPFSQADSCVGMIAAFASAGATPTCASCVLVQSTESGSDNKPSDPTTYVSPTTTGDMLIVFGVHSNYVSGVTMIGQGGGASDIWYPCDNPSSPGGGFHDIPIGGGYALSCNFAVGIQGATADTITINSTDCSTSCTWVAGTYLEYSGPNLNPAIALAAETSGTGTSGTGSNNATGAAVTASGANDLIVSGVLNEAGTIVSGTTPLTWTQRQTISVAVEDAIWSGLGSITPAWTISSSGISYGSITLAIR